jgi:hypothetical protein
MKIRNKLFLMLVISGICTGAALAQPVPVEVMGGNRYGLVNMVYSRNLASGTRFGFFHMNTITFDYNEKAGNSFIIQDLATFEIVKHLKVAGGLAYSVAGLAPTAGLQFSLAGKKTYFLLAPRVNFEKDVSCDIMTILQYKPALSEKVNLYTRFQMLNLFDEAGNIKSYQWFRLGLEVKGMQFGMAVNLDEYGPNPSVEADWGIFIRKEIL